MNITVVGSGGWGTALALVLLENGHQVSMWCRRAEKCQEMQESRENPVLPGVKLPQELELTCDLNVLADSQVVVLATPSFAVRATSKQIAPYLKAGTVLVSVAKGIEKDSCLLLHQVIEEEIPNCPVVVLSGPSHAEEVARGLPTGVVVASENKEAALLAQDIFINRNMRLYTSPDILGVEIGAALKNVVALCTGCCVGMGYGDNTKALIMTRALTEMARLGVAMGANKETFAGLSGLGDLIVTCTSMHSRNCRAGIAIGKGTPVAEAVGGKDGTVVEGYYAAASARQLAHKMGVEMPIAEGAYQVLYEGKDPHTLGPAFACFFADPASYRQPQGAESLQSALDICYHILHGRSGSLCKIFFSESAVLLLLVSGNDSPGGIDDGSQSVLVKAVL